MIVNSTEAKNAVMKKYSTAFVEKLENMPIFIIRVKELNKIIGQGFSAAAAWNCALYNLERERTLNEPT